jgi:hypothetical protein
MTSYRIDYDGHVWTIEAKVEVGLFRVYRIDGDLSAPTLYDALLMEAYFKGLRLAIEMDVPYDVRELAAAYNRREIAIEDRDKAAGRPLENTYLEPITNTVTFRRIGKVNLRRRRSPSKGR